MDEFVKLSTPDNFILQINLNRPSQLNALNQELLKQLSHALENAKQDTAVKAILITGSERAFCAGADINELQSLNGNKGVTFACFGQAVFRQLELLGKPSLAAISGTAFGGGLELAMAATLRIATEQAVFAQPEIKLGVIPGFGGTKRLSRLIGLGRALDLCLTGKRIDADYALRIGLVNELATSDNLLPRALNILKELTQLSPLAMQSIMTVIDEGYNLPLEQALALEAAHFGLCCNTKDKQEGVSAFLEKRKASFTGA